MVVGAGAGGCAVVDTGDGMGAGVELGVGASVGTGVVESKVAGVVVVVVTGWN